MYKLIFKRTIDIIISFIGLIITLPILLIFTVLIAFNLKGNPFFIQKRPGKNEKIFSVIKFRTMLNSRDNSGILLPDHERLFGFGKIVRKLSLDELPQLFNVLLGDMSLIGPRPLLISYLPRYNEFQKKRHSVRPGITGWAQINGRNAINWDEKFNYDVWYVNNISFITDIKILLLTIKKVIVRDGINSDTSATMEEFLGNN